MTGNRPFLYCQGMSATTRDGLAALKAALKAFEIAGNRYLVACAKEWISEVEEEIKAEDRAERHDKTHHERGVH